MEIKVQSIKFDADQKLIDYVNRKVGKLEKLYEVAVRCEVVLSMLPDPAYKNAQVRVGNKIRMFWTRGFRLHYGLSQH